jgi:hypothetical protein
VPFFHDPFLQARLRNDSRMIQTEVQQMLDRMNLLITALYRAP